MSLTFSALTPIACTTGSNPVVASADDRLVEQASIEYTVRPLTNLKGAAVRVCARGFSPRRLEPMVSNGRDALAGNSRALTPSGALPWPTSHRDGLHPCTEYAIRFIRAPYVSPSGDHALLSQTDWLWRPSPMPSSITARVAFELPPGVHVSVPWPPLVDGESPTVFSIPPDAFALPTFMLVGRHTRVTIELGGAHIQLVDIGGPLEPHEVRQWLDHAMTVVGSIGGRLPVSRMLVVTAPAGDGVTPAAFGMVRRGGGTSVLLLLHDNATRDSLQRDWVLVHELSHLWMPLLERDGRWLTEGIATYLQEVLRARCGIQSAAVSWQRLQAGFRRGNRAQSGRMLVEESRDMAATGNFHKVYWSGTAFALEADLTLRRSSAGRMTLLRALVRANADRGSAMPTSADAYLRALDVAAGTTFLRPLGQRYETRRGFPNTAGMLGHTHRRTRAQITRLDQTCLDTLRSPSVQD